MSETTGAESFSATAMDTKPVEMRTTLRDSNQVLLELIDIFPAFEFGTWSES